MRHGSLPLGIALAQLSLWLRPSLVLIALALMAVLCGVGGLARAAHRLAAAGGAVAAAGRMVRRDGAASGPRARAGRAVRRPAAHRGRHSRRCRARCAAKPSRTWTRRVDATPAQQPSQRIDLRVSSLEVVTDAEGCAGAGHWRRAAHRSLARKRASRSSSPFSAASASAPWSACCRRRSITIPASGAARIICSTRALPPRPR